VSVCCGATVTESPVWTPIGSMFSIEQTITTLSLWSRITSSSNSPQPSTDWSIRICEIGDAARPRAATVLNCSSVCAAPPPRPPSVNAGRMMTGSGTSSRAASASSIVCAIALAGIFSPARSIVWRNRSRSSARSIAS
jgi:hypothetical protein